MTIPKPMLGCIMCPMWPKDCFRASDMAVLSKGHPEWFKEWVQKEVWNRRKETDAMIRGRKAHEVLEKSRGVETKASEVIRRLRDRESFWGTLGVCSPRYGFRGTPDAVYFEWVLGSLKVTVLDDKPSWDKAYGMQIDAYGFIFLDPHALFTAGKWSEAEDLPREDFFEAIGYDGDIEIWTQFNIYHIHDDSMTSSLLRPFSFIKHRGPFPKEDQWHWHRLFGRYGARKRLQKARDYPELLAASPQMHWSMKTGGLVKNP